MDSDVFPFFFNPYLNITFPIPVLDLSLTADHLRQVIYNLVMAGLARLEVKAN